MFVRLLGEFVCREMVALVVQRGGCEVSMRRELVKFRDALLVRSLWHGLSPSGCRQRPIQPPSTVITVPVT